MSEEPVASATRRATAVGFVAVLLWSLLALFTVATAPVPPFLLNALTFAIAACAGLIWTAARGRLGLLARLGWRPVAFGTLGLFGYHALYFSALRLAPAAEASLVAYLWPLFLVLFSGLLPGEHLRGGHLLGALAGLAGAALAISSREGGLSFAPGPGHLLALGCALTWSLYSLLSRRFGTVPTEAVTLYCLATALLSLPAHLLFETTLWPQGALAWLAVLGLGLGPVGLAFFVWDIGVKRGDIRLLGSASYAAPLLSTLFLVLAGQAGGGLRLGAAALLITLGAALAMRASRQHP